jgi:squalene-hopene/tetraprenyl-beta-curcumene cyclase
VERGLRRPPRRARGLSTARRHLLSLQHPDGWWKGELETNVTIDAEDLFLRHYLGSTTRRETARRARWIRRKQRADGRGRRSYGGPADLSTTVEAYVALRLAGDPADGAHMRRAAAFVRDGGGIERSRVFTRMWLSLLSLWSWNEFPRSRREILPAVARAALDLLLRCWARQTIVALRSLRAAADDDGAVRRRRCSPGLRSGAGPSGPRVGCSTAALRFTSAGRRRWPQRALRDGGALGRRPQEADGSWGGIQPPWVWSMIGAARAAATRSTTRCDARAARARQLHDRRRGGAGIEACQSPVWDTALALIALLDAGSRRRPAARRRAATLAAGREVQMRGDWAVARPDLADRRLPVRVRERELPRRRRHGRRRAGAARAAARGAARGRPRPRVVARHAASRRRLGRVRRRQHERARRKLRSATSAR